MLRLDMHVHLWLDPYNQPVRQAVHHGPQPWKLHQHAGRFACSMHRLVEGLLKIRRVKVIVCFGEAEFRHNISSQCSPSPVQGQYSVCSSVLGNLGAECVQLGTNDWLEVHDLALGEVGRD